MKLYGFNGHPENLKIGDKVKTDLPTGLFCEHPHRIYTILAIVEQADCESGRLVSVGHNSAVIIGKADATWFIPVQEKEKK